MRVVFLATGHLKLFLCLGNSYPMGPGGGGLCFCHRSWNGSHHFSASLVSREWKTIRHTSPEPELGLGMVQKSHSLGRGCDEFGLSGLQLQGCQWPCQVTSAGRGGGRSQVSLAVTECAPILPLLHQNWGCSFIHSVEVFPPNSYFETFPITTELKEYLEYTHIFLEIQQCLQHFHSCGHRLSMHINTVVEPETKLPIS